MAKEIWLKEISAKEVIRGGASGHSPLQPQFELQSDSFPENLLKAVRKVAFARFSGGNPKSIQDAML